MLRREFIKLPAFAGLLALTPKSSYAENFRRRLDVYQGFNFQRDMKKPVGHLASLRISEKELEKTLRVQDPTKLESSKVVVGVISAIRWDGGTSDPIVFTCQVTAKNLQTTAGLMYNELTNTEVEFALSIYESDPSAAPPMYYRSFHTGGEPIKGKIEKINGMLELEIDHEPSEVVPSPRNYELYISIMPLQESVQELHVVSSSSRQERAKT